MNPFMCMSERDTEKLFFSWMMKFFFANQKD